MDKNKTGKYLKYAIGEIILVVIGILIALSINNWNNNRINTEREAAYIINLERDLNNQLEAINTQMDFEAKIADYCKIALEPYNIENKLVIDSTFAVAMGVITSRRTFLNPNPTYTELISSGNIEIIKDRKFKDQLINYYEELERIEKVIANNNALYTDQEFTPVIMRLGVLDASEDWENIFSGYTNKYSSDNPLNAKNMERLSQISSKLLEDEANELLLVNHLASRQGYALGHIFFLLDLRLKTEKLMSSLKAYNTL
jgi:hypothetical protein